jgi:phosphate transport system protein
LSPVREKYHRELEELVALAEDLGKKAGLAVDKSVNALIDWDTDLAKEVVNGDQVIDDINQKLENRCMKLLALQQPMAKDLRMIIALLKIGIDLERIGDLAVDMARVTIQCQEKTHITKLEYIPRMAQIDIEMLGKALDAMKNYDADLARQTTKWDYEVDGLYVKARAKLMNILVGKPKLTDHAGSLMMVNRHLERIGDHICNICEAIVYMVEAKREHLN